VIKVVIADDDRDVATVLAMLLDRMFDCEVTVCDDGPSCVSAIREKHPHVALVDLQMPGMSGMQVATTLRHAGTSDVMLVAISGYSGLHIQRLCAEAGFDHFELKPISVMHLGELLAIAIKRAEPRCQATAHRA
jgi:CheY-like chemotaxis protein